MQLNSNDMDELFKRAAANYPLKTDNADFDKVAGMLDERDDRAAGFFDKKLAGLLLLLLIGGAATWYALSENNTTKQVAVKNEQAATVITEQIQPKQEKIQTENSTPSSNSYIASSTVNEKTVKFQGQLPGKMSASGGTSEPAALSFKMLNNEGAVASNKPQRTSVNDRNTGSQEGTTKAQTTGTNETDADKSSLIKVEENKATVAQNQTPKPQTTVVTAPKKSSKPESRLYVNVLAGIDKSHVSLQRFSKLGSSYGITVGYNINSHFSFEGGVLSSTKKYFTGAQYFNTAKMNYPSYVKWTSFDGECRMLEIPVVLRYNFNPAPKAQWFITGGVSSYLMKEESYDFIYESYGQIKKASHTYDNASKDWASALHFSGGVEKKFNKKFSFRIEPYIRIPVKKMGYGDLPISSAGLNIGLRHNLF